MGTEKLIENLLAVLPYWHYKIDRPFKQWRQDRMSLETYYCLQMLRRSGGMTMSELAQRLKITRQQATRTIDKLFEHGFVRRIYDEADRRYIRIEATGRAASYIDENVHHNPDYARMLEEKIGLKETEEFEKAIETLLRILPKLD